MGLLAPLFLLGLAAIAVPIVIHMIQRERKEVIEFPSLMFVRRIPFHSFRRQRIRHWFLLLLRCAALALLVLAFARPFVRSPALAAVTDGAREVVVLLDRSYSMGLRDHWTRARDAARDVINGLAPDDRATLILFDSGAAAFWASATRAVSLGWSIHHRLVNGTARVLDALRLPFVVWTIVAAPLFVVSYALIAADAVARGLFLGIDRWVGRAMEYRADRVAATVVGAEPGIAVLSKLHAGIEPSFGLFATHPTTKRRLKRLRRRLSADAASRPDPCGRTPRVGRR